MHSWFCWEWMCQWQPFWQQGLILRNLRSGGEKTKLPCKLESLSLISKAISFIYFMKYAVPLQNTPSYMAAILAYYEEPLLFILPVYITFALARNMKAKAAHCPKGISCQFRFQLILKVTLFCKKGCKHFFWPSSWPFVKIFQGEMNLTDTLGLSFPCIF